MQSQKYYNFSCKTPLEAIDRFSLSDISIFQKWDAFFSGKSEYPHLRQDFSISNTTAKQNVVTQHKTEQL